MGFNVNLYTKKYHGVKNRRPDIEPKKNVLKLFNKPRTFLIAKKMIVKMIAIKNGAFDSLRQVAIVKRNPVAATKNDE